MNFCKSKKFFLKKMKNNVTFFAGIILILQVVL